MGSAHRAPPGTRAPGGEGGSPGSPGGQGVPRRVLGRPAGPAMAGRQAWALHRPESRVRGYLGQQKSVGRASARRPPAETWEEGPVLEHLGVPPWVPRSPPEVPEDAAGAAAAVAVAAAAAVAEDLVKGRAAEPTVEAYSLQWAVDNVAAA